MVAIEPTTSGELSTSDVFEYFFVSATNSFHVVGRSLILSVRYMKPVVPQSLTTEYVLFGSSGVLWNFASTFFLTVRSFDQSSGSSSFAAMSSLVMYPVGHTRS